MTVTAIDSRIIISPTAFFELPTVQRIRSSLEIGLTDRSYLPKSDDLRSDWVASVATPAFKALAQTGAFAQRFCTIGTGVGLDALAAIEILRSETVAFTDLHEDVVDRARQNILDNLRPDVRIELISGAGDLLAPLAGADRTFDVIYENLPNIPLSEVGDLRDGQTSSTFIAKRSEHIPTFAEQYLISLHHVALEQAWPMLRRGGRVLSSIGGRVPLRQILKLAEQTNYSGNILTYMWKRQSEPEEVIGGYAAWESQGLGPFHFYPVAVLEETFEGMSVHAAGAQALAIEAALSSHEITASEALMQLRAGLDIGHTVAILESVK